MITAIEPDLHAGALRLDDWGVIRARGEEAGGFLQSQLTNDVLHLASDSARLAGYCSAKGRLLASFVVWREPEGDLLLACSADLLQATLKRLSMFVLRAKCKLSDASSEVPLWGLVGAGAAAWLGADAPQRIWQGHAAGGGQVLRLPDGWAAGSAVPRWLLAGVPAPALPALDAEVWRWLEVTSGTPRIVAATAEQFVPQMVNLDLVGGVDFHKGCYPGQEVVARSQYRGTLKRRAVIVASSRPLRPGQEVFDAADPGQPAGMVVLAGTSGGRHAALVEIKRAALQAGRLNAPDLAAAAQAPSGEPAPSTPASAVLEVVPLPYPLPSDEA